jgi:hypothetical protein
MKLTRATGGKVSEGRQLREKAERDRKAIEAGQEPSPVRSRRRARREKKEVAAADARRKAVKKKKKQAAAEKSDSDDEPELGTFVVESIEGSRWCSTKSCNLWMCKFEGFNEEYNEELAFEDFDAVDGATPRHATPRHATPRHATPRHATPRHATPRHATPRHATPRHATPRHATQRHAGYDDCILFL